MTPVPRVVLDTNVVLSTLLFTRGRIAPLRQEWRQGRCRPLVSTTTAAELMRALSYPKFKLPAQSQRELLADCLPYCTTVIVPTEQPPTLPCRDPLDIPFLQLALVGQADFLVTGDKDLLRLADASVHPIVTAERFLTLLDKG